MERTIKPKEIKFIEAPGTVPDKLQPHNFEAEEALLGSLLIDRDAILTVSGFLRAEHFFIERHGWIYQAMIDLTNSGTPPDLITLSDELERRGQLNDIGGSTYLTSLINTTPSSLHAEHYAHITERDSVRRQIIDRAGQIARLAFSHEGEAGELIAQAEKLIADVSTGRGNDDRAALVGQVVSAIHDDIDQLKAAGGKAILGLPTGLTDLDRMLGGLQRSNLVIVAGRPGMGKTSLAMQIAVSTAEKQGARSLVFSLEMERKELVRRMISGKSGITENRIKNADIKPDEWKCYMSASEIIAGLPVTINDAPYWTPQGLRSEATRYAIKYGVDLIVVDYLQLIGNDRKAINQNRNQEVTEISRMLKLLARELNVPVLAVSQLSRSCESRNDKRPMLSDLRESGAIEQDADVVMFVYRDDVYNPDTEFPGMAEIIIGKHRSGPTGVIQAYYKKHLTTFLDLEVKRQSLNSIDFDDARR